MFVSLNSNSFGQDEVVEGFKIPECVGMGGNSNFSNLLSRKIREFPTFCGSVNTFHTPKLVKDVTESYAQCRKFLTGKRALALKNNPNKLLGSYEMRCNDYNTKLNLSSILCRSYNGLSLNASDLSVNEKIGDLEASESLSLRYSHSACIYRKLNVMTKEALRPFEAIPIKQLKVTKNSIPLSIKEHVSALIAELDKVNKFKLSKVLAGPSPVEGKEKNDCDMYKDKLLKIQNVYDQKLVRSSLELKAQLQALQKEFEKKHGKFHRAWVQNQEVVSERGGLIGMHPEGGNQIVVKHSGENSNSPSVEICPSNDSVTKINKALRRSVYLAKTPNGGTGTVFLGESKNENGVKKTFQISAAHVALEKHTDRLNENAVDLALSLSEELHSKQEMVRFDSQTSEIHRENDVALKDTLDTGTALPLKTVHGDPVEGQEFIIAGSPAWMYGTNLVNISCKFMGYGTGLNAGRYALDCPTGGYHLGGVSGGPMVDAETGNVWGVAVTQGQSDNSSNEYSFNNRLFVTPLQSDRHGGVIVGQQASLVNKRCFDFQSNLSFNCSVSPYGVVKTE